MPPLDRGRFLRVVDVGMDQADVDVGRYDRSTQLFEVDHLRLTTEGIGFSPIVLRYAHPGELDLMARLAGLRRHDRWGGWQGGPFTADSHRHISVWGA